jgi:hypothetical protein
MDDAPRSTFGDRTIWVRLLYMLFCAIAWSIAELLVLIVALFQSACVLVNGTVHERALRFGRNLAAYMEALLRFVTFNDEQVPFPFSDWPDEAPGDSPWRAGRRGPAPEPATAADPSGAPGSPEPPTTAPPAPPGSTAPAPEPPEVPDAPADDGREADDDGTPPPRGPSSPA